MGAGPVGLGSKSSAAPPTCVSWPLAAPHPTLFSCCRPLTPASLPGVCTPPWPSEPACCHRSPALWGQFPAPVLCPLPSGVLLPKEPRGPQGDPHPGLARPQHSQAVGVSSPVLGRAWGPGKRAEWGRDLPPESPRRVVRRRRGAQTPVGTSTRKGPWTARPATATGRPPLGPSHGRTRAPPSSGGAAASPSAPGRGGPSAPEGPAGLLWVPRVPPHWPLGCCSSPLCGWDWGSCIRSPSCPWGPQHSGGGWIFTESGPGCHAAPAAAAPGRAWGVGCGGFRPRGHSQRKCGWWAPSEATPRRWWWPVSLKVPTDL